MVITGVRKLRIFTITSLLGLLLGGINCYAQHIFKESRTWVDKGGKRIKGVAWKASGDGIKVKTEDGKIINYPYSTMTKIDEAYINFQLKDYVNQKKEAVAKHKVERKREARKQAAAAAAAEERKASTPADSKEARIAKLRGVINDCNRNLEPTKGLLTKPAIKYQVDSRWVNANGGYYKPIYRTIKAETISVMIANGKVVGYPNYPSWYAYSGTRSVVLSPKSVKMLAKQQNALRLKADAERELNMLIRPPTYSTPRTYSPSRPATTPSGSSYPSGTTSARKLTEEDSARISKLQKNIKRYNDNLKPVKGLLFRKKRNSALAKESVSVMIANGQVVGYPSYPQYYDSYYYTTIELSPKSVKTLAQQKDTLRKKKDAEDEIRRIRGY